MVHFVNERPRRIEERKWRNWVNFPATPRGPLHELAHYRDISAIDYGRVNSKGSINRIQQI